MFSTYDLDKDGKLSSKEAWRFLFRELRRHAKDFNFHFGKVSKSGFVSENDFETYLVENLFRRPRDLDLF